MLLTASDVYISNFENVFDFEKTDNPKSVSVYGGSLNITNISGSVSNGGNWSIDSNVIISTAPAPASPRTSLAFTETAA